MSTQERVHTTVYALYNALSYGSNGQLISWYQDYHWWYSYAGWNGPWTYWGAQSDNELLCESCFQELKNAVKDSKIPIKEK